MRPLLRFAAIGTAVTIGLLVAGSWWTRNAPAGTYEAMVWACAVVFAGSLVGAMPLVLGQGGVLAPGAPGEPPAGAGVGPARGPEAVSRFLAAMLVRMGAVAVGAGAVIFLGEVRVESFLLWLAVGYLAFLIVDTAFALRVFRSL
ncbi:MAG: hypothetical protein IH936_08320 [Acidobacteria bacterium]|nr:hypothetical protein [Acidobacteriota bacterium]